MSSTPNASAKAEEVEEFEDFDTNEVMKDVKAAGGNSKAGEVPKPREVYEDENEVKTWMRESRGQQAPPSGKGDWLLWEDLYVIGWEKRRPLHQENYKALEKRLPHRTYQALRIQTCHIRKAIKESGPDASKQEVQSRLRAVKDRKAAKKDVAGSADGSNKRKRPEDELEAATASTSNRNRIDLSSSPADEPTEDKQVEGRKPKCPRRSSAPVLAEADRRFQPKACTFKDAQQKDTSDRRDGATTASVDRADCAHIHERASSSNQEFRARASVTNRTPGRPSEIPCREGQNQRKAAKSNEDRVAHSAVRSLDRRNLDNSKEATGVLDKKINQKKTLESDKRAFIAYLHHLPPVHQSKTTRVGRRSIPSIYSPARVNKGQTSEAEHATDGCPAAKQLEVPKVIESRRATDLDDQKTTGAREQAALTRLELLAYASKLIYARDFPTEHDTTSNPALETRTHEGSCATQPRDTSLSSGTKAYQGHSGTEDSVDSNNQTATSAPAKPARGRTVGEYIAAYSAGLDPTWDESVLGSDRAANDDAPGFRAINAGDTPHDFVAVTTEHGCRFLAISPKDAPRTLAMSSHGY